MLWWKTSGCRNSFGSSLIVHVCCRMHIWADDERARRRGDELDIRSSIDRGGRSFLERRNAKLLVAWDDGRF
jgi:hypothetical protein